MHHTTNYWHCAEEDRKMKKQQTTNCASLHNRLVTGWESRHCRPFCSRQSSHLKRWRHPFYQCTPTNRTSAMRPWGYIWLTSWMQPLKAVSSCACIKTVDKLWHFKLVQKIRGKSASLQLFAELYHTMEIDGPSNPLPAGGLYSFTCRVTSYLPPSVKWLDSDHKEPDSYDPSIKIDGPNYDGNITTLVLTFDHLKTSRGGCYACVSSVSEPTSFKRVTRDIEVQSKCFICSSY